ncbi:MAG: DUF6017 domain-containing protein, partial [Lachnospiraceae bacterium]
FDYYYGVQSEQFSFYRIPRLLIKDQHFKGLSSDAKLLYGLMLDRMALSMKNHWLDNENRAYIIYSIDNVMEDLNCSKPTCVKIMKELSTFGLIERERKGLGKPDIIYVKNFVIQEENKSVETEAGHEEQKCGSVENESSNNDGEIGEDQEYFAEGQFFSEDPYLSDPQENSMTAESKENELPEVKKLNFWNQSRTSVAERKNGFHEENTTNLGAYSVNKGNISPRSKESELPEVKKLNFCNSKNLTSGCKDFLLPEVKNLAPNYNNNSYNNQSYYSIYPSNLSSQKDEFDGTKEEIDKNTTYIEQIKKNLDYEFYMTNDKCNDKALLKELFDIICEVVCVKRKMIKVGGVVYPYEYVRSKFLELTSSHVWYIIDCMKETTTRIVNIKAYLLAALFNAPSTIDHYYQQKVQHDLHSDAVGEL